MAIAVTLLSGSETASPSGDCLALQQVRTNLALGLVHRLGRSGVAQQNVGARASVSCSKGIEALDVWTPSPQIAKQLTRVCFAQGAQSPQLNRQLRAPLVDTLQAWRDLSVSLDNVDAIERMSGNLGAVAVACLESRELCRRSRSASGNTRMSMDALMHAPERVMALEPAASTFRAQTPNTRSNCQRSTATLAKTPTNSSCRPSSLRHLRPP